MNSFPKDSLRGSQQLKIKKKVGQKVAITCDNSRDSAAERKIRAIYYTILIANKKGGLAKGSRSGSVFYTRANLSLGQRYYIMDKISTTCTPTVEQGALCRANLQMITLTPET